MLRILRRINIIIPFFRDILNGTYVIPLGRLLLIILALAYFISPIDIIPDTFLFIGWLDDITIFALVARFLDEELSKYQMLKTQLK